MNGKTGRDEQNLPTVCWIGDFDESRADLGLPKLHGLHTTILYRAEPRTGTYSHHPYIAHHRGTLYATWSNHARDEDAPGQRVLFSLSTDNGRNWRPFAELFPPRDRRKARAEQDDSRDRILIPNGFAPVDGTLYAVAETHVLKDRRGLGRLARSVSPDGPPGPIFWIVEDPPPPKPGFRSYPNAGSPEFARIAETINARLAEPEHLPTWEFLHQSSRPKAADGHQLCEPTQCWELDDGTLVRLYRDLETSSGCQYAQFSFDGGRSWNNPRPTGFPDAYSRAAAGMLPDGTAYVINNPGQSRDALVISLARNGLNFDRHGVIACNAPPVRYEGVYKGAGFQYPRATILDDEMHVAYSVGKEGIRVTTIPLEALEAITPEGKD